MLIQGAVGLVFGVLGPVAHRSHHREPALGVSAKTPATRCPAVVGLVACVALADLIPARRAGRMDRSTRLPTRVGTIPSAPVMSAPAPVASPAYRTSSGTPTLPEPGFEGTSGAPSPYAVAPFLVSVVPERAMSTVPGDA